MDREQFMVESLIKTGSQSTVNQKNLNSGNDVADTQPQLTAQVTKLWNLAYALNSYAMGIKNSLNGLAGNVSVVDFLAPTPKGTETDKPIPAADKVSDINRLIEYLDEVNRHFDNILTHAREAI